MMIKVLLADDHSILRDGLAALLEAQDGITVVGHAADGREAVRKATELKPDVAIMDIVMPELDGIEATRLVQQSSPLTRVLILSMYSTTEHIFRALQAGAKGYLLKESAGAELVVAVRSIHAGRRFLSQKMIAVVSAGMCLRTSTTSTSSLYCSSLILIACSSVTSYPVAF